MVCAVADDVTGDGVVEVTGCGVPVAESHHNTHVSHMTKDVYTLQCTNTQQNTNTYWVGIDWSEQQQQLQMEMMEK